MTNNLTVSGYIGFLVGISISQLPYLIVWLYAKLKIGWDYFRKYLGCSIHEEENTEVIENYYRVKSAEVMEEARKLADANKYKEG